MHSSTQKVREDTNVSRQKPVNELMSAMGRWRVKLNQELLR